MSENKYNALAEALQTKVTDPFDNGDVIRWLAAGRYLYAAIKTPAGWYTTSNNPIVPKVLDYEELVEVLARSGNDEIVVSSQWVRVGD